MFKHIVNKKNTLLVFLFILLQACSGGGGSDDDSDPGNPGENPTLTADKTSIAFSNVYLQNSSESQSVTVTYTGDILGVSEATVPDWFSFSYAEGSNKTGTVTLSAANTSQLEPNIYNYDLRFTASNASGSTTPANLDVKLSILVAEKVRFAAVSGTNTSEGFSSVILKNNTDTWTVSNSADWLTTVLSTDTQTNDISLTSTADTSLITGPVEADITLTNTTTGQVYTIKAQAGIEDVYLFARESAVALVATPNINNDSGDQIITVLNIANTAGSDIDWEASSDADWLTLAKNDDGTQLQIQTDLTKITAETLSSTSISLRADGDVVGENIPVSIYHSSNEIDTFELDTNNININAKGASSALGSSNIYVGIGNDINVYNKYTNQLVETISNVSPDGTSIGNFVIHPKGETLIAQTVDNTSPIKRYSVDLSDNTATEITTATITSDPLMFIKSAGRYIIVTEGMEFANENLIVLNQTNNLNFTPSHISFAQNSNAIFAVNDADNTVNRFELNVNFAAANKVTPTLTHTSAAVTGGISGLAVTRDETDLYLVSTSSEWMRFDSSATGAAAFTDQGILEVDSSTVVVNEGTDTLGLYTPSPEDIATHAVYVNNSNNPYFVRTVTITSDAGDMYETYAYQYNTDKEHITSTLLASPDSQPTTAGVELNLAMSNDYFLAFDGTKVNLKAAPYVPTSTPSAYLLEHTRNESTFVVFEVKMRSIPQGWTWIPPNTDSTPWLVTAVDTNDSQVLDVTLTQEGMNALSEGIYQREIYIYESSNMTSARIKLVLTVPAAEVAE